MDQLTPLVEARALAVGHAGRALISGIGFTLHPGRVLCLLGPNGAGKTTLFRTLLGLIPPISGRIRLTGADLSCLSRAQIATHLAHVPQSLASPFAFSALDVVLMGASARLGTFARPGQAEETRAMAALDRLGIAALAQQDVTRLSGGQRQLVLIARALAQEARVLVMDEPTASLDFANQRAVETAIRHLAASGTALVISTHDPGQAAAWADEALLVSRDGVIASGAAAEVLREAPLSQLYGLPVRRIEGPDGRAHFY